VLVSPNLLLLLLLPDRWLLPRQVQPVVPDHHLLLLLLLLCYQTQIAAALHLWV
jgi:hypothetical protein